jgi:hypothetical protein
MKAFPSGDTNTVLAWGPKLRNDFLPSLMFFEKTAKIDCTPSLLATLSCFSMETSRLFLLLSHLSFSI